MTLRPELVATLVALLVDQLSKLLVIEVLQLDRIGRIEVLPPYLVFRMGWNRGVNFGLFATGSDVARWALVALAIGVAVYFVQWSWRSRQPYMVQISVGLLAGGALGNALDRIRFGAVVDFLNMSCCGIYNPYAFNIADIAVFAGVAGVVVFGWKSRERPGE